MLLCRKGLKIDELPRHVVPRAASSILRAKRRSDPCPPILSQDVVSSSGEAQGKRSSL